LSELPVASSRTSSPDAGYSISGSFTSSTM
jgi:hypothetical protein